MDVFQHLDSNTTDAFKNLIPLVSGFISDQFAGVRTPTDQSNITASDVIEWIKITDSKEKSWRGVVAKLQEEISTLEDRLNATQPDSEDITLLKLENTKLRNENQKLKSRLASFLNELKSAERDLNAS